MPCVSLQRKRVWVL